MRSTSARVYCTSINGVVQVQPLLMQGAVCICQHMQGSTAQTPVVGCRCSYTFIRRKGFETVRAIDLQQNHGKVSKAAPARLHDPCTHAVCPNTLDTTSKECPSATSSRLDMLLPLIFNKLLFVSTCLPMLASAFPGILQLSLSLHLGVACCRQRLML